MEQLASHEGMHVRETDYDFLQTDMKDMQTQEAMGSWSEVQEQEKQLDIQMGIEEEEELERSMELSR